MTEGRLREETNRHTKRRHILWVCRGGHGTCRGVTIQEEATHGRDRSVIEGRLRENRLTHKEETHSQPNKPEKEYRSWFSFSHIVSAV